jgi:glycine C-acetyltransferase
VIPPVLEAAAAAVTASRDGESVVSAAAPGTVLVGERDLINMASCDYLGLPDTPDVLEALAAAA